MEGLADDLVVLAMGPDPEPMDAAGNRQTKCSVVKANTDTMKLAVADGLEVKRRMGRIDLELGIVAPSQSLNLQR